MATKQVARRGKGRAGTGSEGDIVLRVKGSGEKRKPSGSWEHLRKYQYPKGKSANPGGVPKGGQRKIKAAYEAVLGDRLPEDLCEALGLAYEDEPTWADAMALQMVRKAIDSNSANPSFAAVTELRETTEGKTPDKFEGSGPDGAPFATPTFQVNFVKPEGDEHDG